MKTYPQPGTTKFSGRLPDSVARFIAHEHYDVVSIAPASDSTGEYHAVKTLGGYVACIGLIDGSAMILHKLPDGTRELETAVLP